MGERKLEGRYFDAKKRSMEDETIICAARNSKFTFGELEDQNTEF